MGKETRVVRLEDFEPLIGGKSIERIRKKAAKFQGFHVVNINSTYYGGGVAELLSSMTLLMNGIGIKAGWRVMQGSPDYFSITKKMHNALQGDDINLSKRKIELYEEIVEENSIRNHLGHEMVIVHDPQPLPMVKHYKKHGPWVWRCHLDMSNPNKELWNYLTPIIEKYDAVIFSLQEYQKKLETPQLFFMPAINPFSIKNKEMSEREIRERLGHYNIPTDLPLVVQVSRFDSWKDPQGVIEAFKLAQKEVKATLVLLGNVATDDPEGVEVYQSLLDSQNERIIILSVEDTALVNALQRHAAVVLQKSIREGFGLTVTEAMWKGAAVIGGNAGGIRYQIRDGENGFLVSSIEEAARRIVELIKDKRLRKNMGRKARETVKRQFLMTRLLEQYLDMFASFETIYRLR
ncbi:MAG: glycosyl transferase family 1 [Planctomycetes bacterium GWF2_41_51]|nr:MAG: glycosyl transferase family 1 [Planctomycetes bacterium GWF2_41_51]